MAIKILKIITLVSLFLFPSLVIGEEKYIICKVVSLDLMDMRGSELQLYFLLDPTRKMVKEIGEPDSIESDGSKVEISEWNKYYLWSMSNHSKSSSRLLSYQLNRETLSLKSTSQLWLNDKMLSSIDGFWNCNISDLSSINSIIQNKIKKRKI